MSIDNEHRSLAFRAILPEGFRLSVQSKAIELQQVVRSRILCIKVKFQLCAEVKSKVGNCYCSLNACATRSDGRIVISLNASGKVTTIGEQSSMTVQPHMRILHSTVEREFTIPHFCLTSICLCHIRQHESTLTLLDETHISCKGTAFKSMRIVIIPDSISLCSCFRRSRALNPCGSIIYIYIRCSTISNRYSHIVSLTSDDILTAVGDSTAISYLRTSIHRERRWSCRYILQFTNEV